MANISRTADPIFNFFFLKCAEFNLESPISGQIFDISLSFSEKLKKLIFRPGNHEIGNTAKFWRVGKKTNSGFGLSDPKSYGNKWFCFRTKVELILLNCVIGEGKFLFSPRPLSMAGHRWMYDYKLKWQAEPERVGGGSLSLFFHFIA